MKYRIGFRNGMVITIDGESIRATATNDIEFLTSEKNFDTARYVRSNDVLFVAPADSSHVEKLAVAPFSEK